MFHVQIKLRGDLVVSQEKTGTGTDFVVKDPVSGRSSRFKELEYFIAQQLDGSTSFNVIRHRVEEKYGVPLTQSTFEQFADHLKELRFLEGAEPWIRKGECNSCGMCCQYLGRDLPLTIVPPTGPDGDIDREFIAVRGLQLDEKTGWATQMIHAFSPCTVHDNENKRCLIYDRRPETCRTFPAHPAQIEKTPCSYWFEWEEKDKIIRVGGEGSPYPGRSSEVKKK